MLESPGSKRGMLILAIACLTLAATARGEEEQHEVQVIDAKFELPPEDARPPLEPVVKSIRQQTTAYRKQHDLPPLQIDAELAATAQDFANYMAENDRYGHRADGRRPADRAKAHGYEYCIITENIAYRYNSQGFTVDELAGKFANGWFESKPHRENILDPDVMHTAVAVAFSGTTGHYYGVQLFGRPKSASINFQVVNKTRHTIHYTVGGKPYTLEPRYARGHQRCRPNSASFVLLGPGGSEKAIATKQPTSGERYVAETSRGELTLNTEQYKE